VLAAAGTVQFVTDEDEPLVGSELVDYEELARLFPAPEYATRMRFGPDGFAQVCGDRIYGAVEQPDGTWRFAWLDGDELRVAPVSVGWNDYCSLVADGTAALVVTDDGHLVEVPFDGSAPRPLYDCAGYEGGGGTAVALHGGGYAMLTGGLLTLLRPDGSGGLVEAAWYDRTNFSEMRAVHDGRVLLLASGGGRPGVEALGCYANNRLAVLAIYDPGPYEDLPLYCWGTVQCCAWPVEPYIFRPGWGFQRLTGLLEAWEASASEPEWSLFVDPIDRPEREPPRPFEPVPVVGGAGAAGTVGPYLTEVLDEIRAGRPRAEPDRAVLDLIEPTMGPELVALIETWAGYDHDDGELLVGYLMSIRLFGFERLDPSVGADQDVIGDAAGAVFIGTAPSDGSSIPGYRRFYARYGDGRSTEVVVTLVDEGVERPQRTWNSLERLFRNEDYRERRYPLEDFRQLPPVRAEREGATWTA
jgi:hypothetical protein